jgi:hypothetical protein
VKHILTVAVVILVTLLSPTSGFTQGAQVLTLIPSTRAYGLGEGGVADASDPANVYFNPGVISSCEGVFFMGGYGKLVPELASDIYTVNAGAGAAFEISSSASDMKMRVGGEIRFGLLDYGHWNAIDQNNHLIGLASSSEKYLSLTLGGGVGFRNGTYFGAGISAKPWWIDLAPGWVTEDDQPVKGSAIAFDLGLIAQADLPGVPSGARVTPSIGLSVLNVGPDIKFRDSDRAEPLPTSYRLGVGVRMESPSLKEFDDMVGTRIPIGTLGLNFEMIDDSWIHAKEANPLHNWRAGAEISALQALFLRCGYVNDKYGDVKGATFGAGLGLKLKMLWGRIDFASVPQATTLGRVEKYGLSGGVTF